MLPVFNSWVRGLLYFFFGICFYEECAVSGNIRSTSACGNVFITVSSVQNSFIELNWDTNNCHAGDVRPETIALYNMDIRNKTQKDVILYAEIKVENHPEGFYKTKTPFNISSWPQIWRYNSSTLRISGPQNLPYWIVSFSNSEQIIDVQSLKLQPTWMNDNRDKLKSYHLGNLLIPGTHDSGCYGGLSIFEDYILTQDMPIWHQLVSGIRYLDLRIGYHQDELFYINHDFVRVKKVQIIYDQIRKFLERSPGEVIIVDFHRFPFPSSWPRSLHEKFINYTLSELGEYAYSKTGAENAKGPTMEQIWNAGKNIIFTYAEKRYTEKYPQLWKAVPQFWADTINVQSLKTFLEVSLNKSGQTTFNALMAELTPRFVDVFTGTNTLRELANKVNSNLTKWVRDEWNRKVNIVTSDFFFGNDLINVAIDVNTKR